MRFAATFQDDCLRVVEAVYVFGMPFIYFLASGIPDIPVYKRVLEWVVWLMMLVAMRPQYYEVRDEGLFLRLRWKTRLLSYASLVEVSAQPNRRGRSTAVDLVRVTTNTGESATFGVEQKDRFLQELWKRVPKLHARVCFPE